METIYMDLGKELGNKIDLFEKHGLVNELEDMFKNPELIELDIEDLKEVLNGEITGTIFKTISWNAGIGTIQYNAFKRGTAWKKISIIISNIIRYGNTS